jgi:hypothetical protein
VAGGIRHAGLMLDVHSRATHASTRTDPRREQVVDWPCEPENVLAQALGRDDAAPALAPRPRPRRTPIQCPLPAPP